MRIGNPAPDHSQILGVGTDDHHAILHAISSALVHSGVITDTQHGVRTLADAHAHSAMSGLTANNHHAETHTHALTDISTIRLSGTTVVGANTAVAVSIQSVSATLRHYQVSIRGDAGNQWNVGARVSGGEAVEAALHSTILRGSTGSDDFLRVVNGTGTERTASHEVVEFD